MMLPKTSALLLLCHCLLLTKAQEDAGNADNYVYRWSSTGGGWRAMFACAGFVNVFQQAGILNDKATRFSAIATTSGASWFSTQLFYSQAFFDQTVMAQAPQDLYNFTIQWMEAYHQLVESNSSTTSDINDKANITDLQASNATEQSETEEAIDAIFELFDVIDTFDGDWAAFVNQMLQAGAEAYGHDGDFATTVANSDNRLPPLQDTTLLIQAALDPTTRVRMGSSASTTSTSTERNNLFGGYDEAALATKLGINATSQDWATYIGPLSQQENSQNLDEWDYYSVPIALTYIVNDTYTGFQYATFDSESSSDVSTFASPIATDISFLDLETYYLYPPSEDATALLTASDLVNANEMSFTTRVDNLTMTSTGTMPRPFGGTGQATVIQVAAMSSAAAGLVSPASPSVFSQALSKQRDQVLETKGFLALVAFDLAVAGIYEIPFWDNVAVCAQWPNPCGPTDGYLIDGTFVDNPAFAMNVAEYQHQADADLSKTLRIVLTNTNQAFHKSAVSEILQYFETDFNQGIPPGEYIWFGGIHLPRRSMQVFQETLNYEDLFDKLEPLPGSNMTTAILKATTIDNPALGITAGQSVEMMLINLNEPITTFIAAPSIIEETTIPLAEMVKAIASNQELVARIQAFVPPLPNPDGEVSRAGEPVTVVESSASSSCRCYYWISMALGMGWWILMSCLQFSSNNLD